MMADVLSVLLADLAAESEALCDVLQCLDGSQWDIVTAARPWTIKDQISHLACNDDATVRALIEPDRFLAAKPSTPEGIQQMVDQVIVDYQHLSGAELLTWFQDARASLMFHFTGKDPKERMPWYGPDMSLTSKITARFMETWAHGLDVVDSLNLPRDRSDRIRHVVFLGLQAMPNSFTARGLPVPTEAVRLVVTAPSGEVWNMGKPEATNVVTGDAYELALLVCQRVHVADTNLHAEGPIAGQWLQIAQAFAGPPGPGRSRRSA